MPFLRERAEAGNPKNMLKYLRAHRRLHRTPTMWMSLDSVILTFKDVPNRICQFKVARSPRNFSNFPKLPHPI